MLDPPWWRVGAGGTVAEAIAHIPQNLVNVGPQTAAEITWLLFTDSVQFSYGT